MAIKDCNNRIIKELDVVRIFEPVSGKSFVEEKEVSFPAGTEGTVVDLFSWGCTVEIGWLTSDVSDDGLLVDTLAPDQLEVIWRMGDPPLPKENVNDKLLQKL